MQIKRTVLVVALAAVAVAGLSAQAIGGRGNRAQQGPRAGGPGGPPFERALQLTDAQRTSLQTLREKEREAIKPLAEQARPLRERLREAVDSSADATTVGQLVLDIHSIEKQIQEIRKSYREQFTALLTAEQKQKLETLESLMGPGRGGRGRGPGGPGFGPPPFDGPPPAGL